jgi:glutamate dehydrogenase
MALSTKLTNPGPRAALGAGAESESFASLLFAGAGTEGLAGYSPEDLAQMAREGFRLLEARAPGRPRIATRAARFAGGPVTVVEILNDDMPFLVDSVMGEIQAGGHAVHLVLHPILKVRRSPAGALEAILGPGDRNWSDGRQESFIAVHLDPLGEPEARRLAEAIGDTLEEVRLAVADWQAMLSRFDAAITALERSPPRIAPGLLSESLAFCRWLRDGHFTFLGLREFRLDGDETTGDIVPVDGTGLGILRDPTRLVLSRNGEGLVMTPQIRAFVFAPQPLIITKSNLLARVHRRVNMDYVGLKTYDTAGRLAGELRLVGLFTSQAYTEVPRQIPFLRHKTESVAGNLGFPASSHAGKALANILDTFPRDELFQIGEKQLTEWARAILDLDLRPRVRAFLRHDRFDRFVSALVYVPRDRFSTANRERIGAIIARAVNGRVTSFTPFFTEGRLVRVQYLIGRDDGEMPPIDAAAIEAEIAAATRTWDDQLAEALAEGGARASLGSKYAGAFSAGYAETFAPARAIEDIARIERLGSARPVAIDFYRVPGAAANTVRAAIYRLGAPIPLSERVPVLENLGFRVIDERSYRIRPQFPDGRREVALHDMVLETADGAPIDLDTHDVRMEETVLAVLRGAAENDAFNRLVAAAGADWREASVLRALAAYLRQIRSPFGPRYIAETLANHAGMARDLIELFRTRFDPDLTLDAEARKEGEARIRARIESALAKVESLDEDRILRHYLNLISATVRTSFFGRDEAGQPPETIAFKLASREVEGLAEPRPFREIWVHSPRLEAIHLRFAPIARGGIRWSDRAQDFRTEVLGLCKAQQVKNTVIVPQGAKGGFVPKLMPRGASREEVMKEGISVYRAFVSSMLAITDNLVEGRIVPPARVVRHEDDDPYLVVAADKGTATFSDIANAVAVEHGFWLGDAFASGGSAGYDHKKMAITARGAWECVKRHFREMDVDIQTTPFRVVGVGDMSGDVFGNGMLLSPAIRLLGAFDHRDIFIDPDPDPARSLAERRRIFALPRSSWQDYDRSAISKGGGVFPRSAKSIALSDEMRRVLGVASRTMTPAELMRALLAAETDLLWFGGIGTYVRGSGETDEQAGDRANDAIRVTGLEVRARVVGEGANLGLTQRGRIELASRGVRLNTDFIDNSAGVNSSDQEVNIKIALGPAVASGRLDGQARKALLASMTDDVAAACLANNYQQSLALSLAERRSAREIGILGRLMRNLEGRGLLDRAIEGLASDRELAARQAAGSGLTRPELAVLLSTAKIALSYDLLASDVPDDPACRPLLLGYFPPALRASYAGDLEAHRLRREIVATWLTNDIINRGGPAFVVRLLDETGRGVGDIARAFLAVREAFGLEALWRDVDALDGRIRGAAQLDLYAGLQDLVIEQTTGTLRRGAVPPATAIPDAVREAVLASATEAQRRQIAERAGALVATGVPGALSARIAELDLLALAPQIADTDGACGGSIAARAAAHLAATELLRIAEIKARAGQVKGGDYYDRLALDGAIATLEAAARAIAAEAGATAGGIAAWLTGPGRRFAAAKAALDEIAGAGEVTVSRLTVAAAQARDLAGA